MTPLEFLGLSLALSLIGAFASLILGRSETLASGIASVAGVLAAASGLGAGLLSLTGPVSTLALDGPYPFAHFVLRLDPLAGLMVAVISLLSLVAWIYGLAYVREYSGRGVGGMGFFMHLFIASMMLVVTADNAFWFLIFFEMMSLASYFLVIFDEDKNAVGAGFLYFFVAHAGSVLIMAAFFLLANAAGSFDFEAFRHVSLSAPMASTVFVLGFLGFGAKAGMIPLHIWLPKAHPAAPSHASALMSGVMIKIGIFGIVKVALDLLGGGQPMLWWGVLVLAFGAVSSVLGVVYALAEHDIKKLLAYHSVENIGIILLGVGTGMIGLAEGQPVLAVLGLMAGLYHLVNHAVFKGLLFLGAGSVIFRVHTKDMEEMGGLAKTMPWTALSFLVGALAISAIPPLNGFVSEWYTYQGLFAAALSGSFLVQFATPIAAVMLALTGALAVMCFVKAYGVIFAGPSRSAHAAHATEAPAPMVTGMVVLALACVCLGLAAPWIAPVIGGIASATLGLPTTTLADGALLIPGAASTTVLSTPLIAILLLALATLPIVVKAMFSGTRIARRRSDAPWAAGYLPDIRMALTAKSFAQPIRMFFVPLYAVRKSVAGAWSHITIGFENFVCLARRTEPWADTRFVDPVTRGVTVTGRWMQVIQGGDFRIYCLYIVGALIVLLAVAAH
ncbi:hydrogenase 4 subunit B [Consotaella salsifontis]|uniref:Hydrogenase-4 component B n=1 Tax=Consotaella salsifontis TaxID=1365950 RepID=A0A1T4RNL1_9HYPH|nr:hydrogenase 4 subunit B [Consotaella salsifontis]SKA17338.1 hydrogenase-4 component B [Consotaella salsifontis]